MMLYCFDTSALNRLHDDPAREEMVAALLATGRIWITCYNVLEAARTAKAERRWSLVRLMRRLSDGQRPLDQPKTIVRSAAAAFSRRQLPGGTRLVVNGDEHMDGVVAALSSPEELDDVARAEVDAWSSQFLDEYDDIAVGDRDRYQALLAAMPPQDHPSTSFTLRGFMSHREGIFEHLVAPIYARETGEELSRDEFDDLMEEPIWCLYLGGYGYVFHQRSVRVQDFGRKRNVGGIDATQAVYLRLCQRFVTHDRAQWKALRFLSILARARGHQVDVLTYQSFRNRMLPFG
jgi:predicted nucleic acid-binding protein